MAHGLQQTVFAFAILRTTINNTTFSPLLYPIMVKLFNEHIFADSSLELIFMWYLMYQLYNLKMVYVTLPALMTLMTDDDRQESGTWQGVDECSSMDTLLAILYTSQRLIYDQRIRNRGENMIIPCIHNVREGNCDGNTKK